MKTNCFRHATFATLVAGLLAGASSARAQTEKSPSSERRPGTGDEPGRFQRPMAGGPAGRLGPGFDRLQSVLTEEQRASMREAMQAQREKLRQLEEQIREQRQQLMLAGIAEKFDEEAVRKKALAVAKVEAEMTVLRAKAFSQIRPALTPEQIEKLKAAPPGPGQDQPETQRRRPDVTRDEHGLPLKDSPPAARPPSPQ